MGETKVSMKLLIDTGGKRVLFAEAGKDCVDFLFFILTLPLSTLIRLLGKKQMVGSLGNLYDSIETLNESYIQSNVNKDSLLKPVSQLPGYSVPLLSLEEAAKNFYRCGSCYNYVTDDTRATCPSHGSLMTSNITYVAPPGVMQQAPQASAAKKFFKCGSCYKYVTDEKRVTCPTCICAMSSIMTYVAPPGVQQVASGSKGGFVKEVVTYMVMDDLVVKPMSTISSITLLNQFNINNVASLEEKVINLGMNEAVKLLKASLVSNKVLTDVFLAGKK